MAYSVGFTPSALRDLKKIPKTESTAIISKIESILSKPYSSVIRLKNSKLYRLRSGNYRAIMSIDKKSLSIIVVKVGHRSDIYKKI